MNDAKYGTLINRIKAMLIDTLVLAGLGVGASSIISDDESLPDSFRIIAFVFIFLLYDPIFTSLVGATIGHMLIGLKIRRVSDETRKIIFPLALVRYIFKAFLGWISLLTVTGTKKKMAIHDSIVGSVVLKA